MDEPNADTLLALIEAGAGLSAHARVKLALSAFYPDLADTDVGRMALGEADRLILMERIRRSGAHAKLCCECPECASAFEFDVNLHEILDVRRKPVPENFELIIEDKIYQLAPVTLDDVDRISASLAEVAASIPVDAVLNCALRGIIGDGGAIERVSAARLSRSDRSVIANALDDADPLSVIVFPIACNSCGHEWAPRYEPIMQFWSELELAADSLIDDVHILAREFGWREQDILDMPAARRRRYATRLRSGAHV